MEAVGGDGSESTGVEVVDGLLQFVAGVHDERSVLRDGFTDRGAPEEVDVEIAGAVRGEREGVATAEDGELSLGDGSVLESGGSGTEEGVWSAPWVPDPA